MQLPVKNRYKEKSYVPDKVKNIVNFAEEIIDWRSQNRPKNGRNRNGFLVTYKYLGVVQQSWLLFKGSSHPIKRKKNHE